MKSMTGYAFLSRQDENASCTVEIRGYNSRFLEIVVNMPGILAGLESSVRDKIAQRFSRGKIEAYIKIRDHSAPYSIVLNRGAAQSYYNAASELAELLKLDEKPSLSMILNLEGALEIEKNRDDPRYWSLIEPALKTAIREFEAERIREGRDTEEDILGHVRRLEECAATIAALRPVIENTLQENLRARFQELLKDHQIDENRILTETAALLMKYTIAEELARLGSHLEAFREETAKNPCPGKKLDFLCQEINREINTIGSKTPNLEVSRAVVTMKEALENIREQLRNVE